jgi:hypothetical protein
VRGDGLADQAEAGRADDVQLAIGLLTGGGEQGGEGDAGRHRRGRGDLPIGDGDDTGEAGRRDFGQGGGGGLGQAGAAGRGGRNYDDVQLCGAGNGAQGGQGACLQGQALADLHGGGLVEQDEGDVGKRCGGAGEQAGAGEGHDEKGQAGQA